MKEIDTKRYGDDIQILLTNNPVFRFYCYSDALLKHMPKNSLKFFEKTMVYSKKVQVSRKSRQETK